MVEHHNMFIVMAISEAVLLMEMVIGNIHDDRRLLKKWNILFSYNVLEERVGRFLNNRH
jgi:hypothetical protein